MGGSNSGPPRFVNHLMKMTSFNRYWLTIAVLFVVLSAIGCQSSTDLKDKTDPVARLNPGMSPGQREAMAQKKHDNGEKGY